MIKKLELIIVRGLIIILSAVLGFWIVKWAMGFVHIWQTRSIRTELWKEIQPVVLKNCEMARYGAPFDSGYLVCKNHLKDIEVGYSYGIAAYDPWSCDIALKHSVEVHQYDCFNTTKPRCENGNGTYHFHKECIGPTEERIDGKIFNSLEGHLRVNGDYGKKIALKMDIEGAEVDSLLATSDEVLKNVQVINVELHDVSDERYLKLVKRLKQLFYVVDLHFNNHRCRRFLMPFPGSVFELLLVNKNIAEVDEGKKPSFPNPFWSPNTQAYPDCQGEATSLW